MSFNLSPSEEEEWVALQEQLAEEEQERRGLEERQREIHEKIDTQSSDVAREKRRNKELQQKVPSMCPIHVYSGTSLTNVEWSTGEDCYYSEVSSFQRFKCMQEWYLGWEKCPV